MLPINDSADGIDDFHGFLKKNVCNVKDITISRNNVAGAAP